VYTLNLDYSFIIEGYKLFLYFPPPTSPPQLCFFLHTPLDEVPLCSPNISFVPTKSQIDQAAASSRHCAAACLHALASPPSWKIQESSPPPMSKRRLCPRSAPVPPMPKLLGPGVALPTEGTALPPQGPYLSCTFPAALRRLCR
jgi:hypothetical protein